MICQNPKCNCSNCMNPQCNCEGTRKCNCTPESIKCCCGPKLVVNNEKN